MDVDHIVPLVGEFGRYQMIIVTLFCILFFPLVYPFTVTFFVAHNPGWKCSVNRTSCRINGTILPGNIWYATRCSMARDDWEFARPRHYSIVTQFDLYCDREDLIPLTTSIFFVGCIFGAILMGYVADRYGRRFVLFPSLFATMTVTCLSSLSPNIYVFIITRFLVGFFTPAVSFQIVVLSTELVGQRYRPLSGSMVWISFCCALAVLGLKAYLIRNWKHLLLVCTLPYYFVFLFYKIIPESVRWLRIHGKIEEAEEIFRKIAKFNKKPEILINLSRLDNEEMKNLGNVLDMFWPLPRLIRTLAQSFGWFTCGMVYYGIVLAADDLGGSMYRDYILLSLIEVPAVMASIYISNRYGRKTACTPFLYITSFMFISIAMIPESAGLTTVRVFYGLIGKFCISLSFASICTWAVELYPTSIRSEAMGWFQVTSRLGAAGSPWVAKWLRGFELWLPFAVLGGFSFAGAVAMQWLPETRNTATPETLKDICTIKAKNEKSNNEQPISNQNEPLMAMES